MPADLSFPDHFYMRTKSVCDLPAIHRTRKGGSSFIHFKRCTVHYFFAYCSDCQRCYGYFLGGSDCWYDRCIYYRCRYGKVMEKFGAGEKESTNRDRIPEYTGLFPRRYYYNCPWTWHSWKTDRTTGSSKAGYSLLLQGNDCDCRKRKRACRWIYFQYQLWWKRSYAWIVFKYQCDTAGYHSTG